MVTRLFLPLRRLAVVLPVIASLALLPIAEVMAQGGGDLPRFASIRAGEVNLRTGPGQRYPVEWVYRRHELPVQIIAEFDTWRRIRDWDGDIGWVHQSMLSGRRTVLLLGPEVAMMRSEPTREAGVIARLEPGVIAQLDECQDRSDGKLCQTEVAGYRGWISAERLWGISSED